MTVAQLAVRLDADVARAARQHHDGAGGARWRHDENPLPVARGERYVDHALVAQAFRRGLRAGQYRREAREKDREASAQASVNDSVPSFSIVLSIRSPAFNHTWLSFGLPTITPGGVPVKMMSPGSSVNSFEA